MFRLLKPQSGLVNRAGHHAIRYAYPVYVIDKLTSGMLAALTMGRAKPLPFRLGCWRVESSIGDSSVGVGGSGLLGPRRVLVGESSKRTVQFVLEVSLGGGAGGGGETLPLSEELPPIRESSQARASRSSGLA